MDTIFYTVIDKRPEFIIKQQQCLENFFDSDFSHIVVNNAKTPEGIFEIHNVCYNLGISCIEPAKSDHSDYNMSYATALQWCYESVILKQNKKKFACILDCDVLPVKKFSIKDMMLGYSMAGILQTRTVNNNSIFYLWPAFLVFDMDLLPNKEKINLMCGFIGEFPTDVGGHLYLYLKDHPEVNVRFLNCLRLDDRVSSEVISTVLTEKVSTMYDKKFSFDVIENTFLHYRAVSNWWGKDTNFIHKKDALFFKIVDDCLAGILCLTDCDFNNIMFKEAKSSFLL